MVAPAVVTGTAPAPVREPRAHKRKRPGGVDWLVLAFAIGLVLTAPDIPVLPMLAVLVPLMIVVPTLAYPFSKTIWVSVDRALLQHLDRNESLDEQFRPTRRP